METCEEGAQDCSGGCGVKRSGQVSSLTKQIVSLVLSWVGHRVGVGHAY